MKKVISIFIIALTMGMMSLPQISHAIGEFEATTYCTASDDYSFCAGFSTDAIGYNSTAMGSSTEASGAYSTAMGYYTEASGDKSMVIGSGIQYGLELVNNTDNSLAVGFNSDTPTFFVGGGDGTSGSLGKVGVGTSDPKSILHVDNGYFQASKISLGAPLSAECSNSNHTGRLVIDPRNDHLYICLGTKGWKYAELN